MNKSLLDLYTDYLTSAFGQTMATAPSRLPVGEIGHDHVTGVPASPAKTGADLWRVVKPLAWQIESRDGVLMPNDSIEENRPIPTIMNWSAGVGITPKSSPPKGSISGPPSIPQIRSDGSTGAPYQAPGNLTIDYDWMTTLNQRRWSIEVYHKPLKQNAGPERSLACSEPTSA